MKINDDVDTNLTDQNKSPKEKKVKNENDWRNDHGRPSYKYLQSLASEDSLGSLEKLKSIATDLNVEFGPNTPPEILAELISLSTRGDDPQTTS